MKLFKGGVDVEVEILSIMADGEPLKLIERAGRTAYQSQDKINDKSAVKFVTMLRNLGHESVLEHSAMTVRFSNCSRGLTHELVRHRLAAFTQESTRYVDESDFEVVIPPGAEDPDEIKLELPHPATGEPFELSLSQYLEWNETVYRKLRGGDYKGKAEGKRGWKQQDARQFLPIGITAEIVVTANLREWRHIIGLRTQKASHWEIRCAMVKLLEMAKEKIPVIFDDFKIEGKDKDGAPFTKSKGH